MRWREAADGLLSTHVDEQGRVRYEELRDDLRLGKVRQAIAHQDPNGFATPEDCTAFWINAYNVAALDLVLRTARKGRRIRRRGLRGTWAKFRFFFLMRTRVARRRRTLFGLEHLTIRGLVRDPRLHFALVCASESCPPLRDSLFHGNDLERELELAARAFMRPGAGYRLDRERGILHASRIFKWYRRDFRSIGGIVGAVRRWGDPEDAQFLSSHKTRLRFQRYDWSLNAASQSPSPTANA